MGGPAPKLNDFWHYRFCVAPLWSKAGSSSFPPGGSGMSIILGKNDIWVPGFATAGCVAVPV